MRLLKTLDNQTLAFNFVMGKYGWARLDFALDDFNFGIRLSEVFPPFEDLMAWVDNIADSKLSATVQINEEGYITSLIAEPNPFDDTIQFIVKGFDYDKVFLNIGVYREDFSDKFREELIRFFKKDFCQHDWRSEDNDDYYDLKSVVLNHQWLYSSPF